MNIASAAIDPKTAPEPSEEVLGLFCTVKNDFQGICIFRYCRGEMPYSALKAR